MRFDPRLRGPCPDRAVPRRGAAARSLRCVLALLAAATLGTVQAATAAAGVPGSPAADGAAPAPWTLVGRQGIVQLVIVPTTLAADRQAYADQLARLCPTDQTCFVNFYTNTTGATPAVPLPDAIAGEATALFRRSAKQGAELFQWSCRMGKTDEGVSCF